MLKYSNMNKLSMKKKEEDCLETEQVNKEYKKAISKKVSQVYLKSYGSVNFIKPMTSFIGKTIDNRSIRNINNRNDMKLARDEKKGMPELSRNKNMDSQKSN